MDKITIQRPFEVVQFEEQPCRPLGVMVQNYSQVSDGYHTIAELYDHRITLYIALCRTLCDFTCYNCDVPDRLKQTVWRSKKHSDGTDAYAGWFVLGIGKEDGKIITYHIPMARWDDANFAETIDCAFFDGHTSADVLERLKSL